MTSNTHQHKNTVDMVINSAVIIGSGDHKTICISLNIPQLKSVRVADQQYPNEPEVDFNKKLGEGGLGIKNGDLYYITIPIGPDVHIITNENKRVILESSEHGIKEVYMTPGGFELLEKL